MAISNVRNAADLTRRLPGSSQTKSAAINDMDKAVEHLQRYAEKNKVKLRDSMKT